MTIKQGIVHEVPKDIETALLADNEILTLWNKLTPIQRNEWICWVTIVKKPETRIAHLQRLLAELKEGIHQPCCWPGCPHRKTQTTIKIE